MAISPNMNEDMALEIRRMYENAELILLNKVANRLVKDGQSPDWMNRKLAELTPLVREIESVMSVLDRTVPNEIEKMIELAYVSGNQSAANDFKELLAILNNEGEDIPSHPAIQKAFGDIGPRTRVADLVATIDSMVGINTGAVEALAAAATGNLTNKHVPIVRATSDMYRKIILEVGGNPLIGIETRLQATQRALNMFADQGIRTFRDRGGRTWEMSRYAEMAVRTMIGQASMQGHADQQTSYGFDLSQVSDHREECPLCRPWEGQVVSLSGDDPNYPSLAEATAAGLFHTYCGHRLNTYFEGITDPLTNTEDPEGYEEKQEQRRLERGIRKWKKRQAVAVTPEEKKAADAKLEQWNEAMSKFIDETGRVRKRSRETIMAGIKNGNPKIPKLGAARMKAEKTEKQVAKAATKKAAAAPKPKKQAAAKSTVVKLQVLEDEIRNLPYEIGAVYDKNGNQVWRQVGEAAMVDISDAIDKGVLRGNILTHNHPSSQSFSFPDVRVLMSHQLREIRAVGDKADYSLSMTDQFYDEVVKGGRMTWDEVMAVMNQTNNEVRESFQKQVNWGMMTPEEAQFKHGHEVWTRLADKGWFNYTREVRKK